MSYEKRSLISLTEMSKDLCLLYVRDMYKRIKLEITILEQIDTPYQLDLQTT